jgi:hypothetical protein
MYSATCLIRNLCCPGRSVLASSFTLEQIDHVDTQPNRRSSREVKLLSLAAVYLDLQDKRTPRL